jgi:peptidoglycan/LPS O-acetylase OafA/YrhL
MVENILQDRHNNFNLLRLIFAILVLLSHSFELIDGNRTREILTSIFHTISFGEFAVDGFFLLSGYLIVQSWQYLPQPWQFLKKRILRIYPGFIVASIICTFVVAPLGSDIPHYVSYFSGFPILDFLENTAMLSAPITRPIFLGQPYPMVNGAMWTIFIEFECYLAVLLIGFLGGIDKRQIWLGLTLAILCLFSLQHLGFSFSDSIPIRLGSFFFVGGSFYLYKELLFFNRKLVLVSAILLIILMANDNVAELALAILGGYLLFQFAFMPSPFLSGFLKFPDISYGVYLYGWPTQKLLLWNFPMMSTGVLFILSCCICFICGSISWYGIEKQLLKLK